MRIGDVMTSRKFLKCLSIFLLSLTLVCCTQEGPTVYDSKGNPVQLSHLKGKWIIVNYWASWCPSCAWEVPHLNHFYQTMDKNVVLYGVNSDDREELEAAVKTAGIEFPVLRENPNEAWQLDPVEMLPTTFIINPKGKVVKTIVGASTEKSLRETLRMLQADE
jgi:peroxiredoxin